jgi:hypothetical protein
VDGLHGVEVAVADGTRVIGRSLTCGLVIVRAGRRRARRRREAVHLVRRLGEPRPVVVWLVATAAEAPGHTTGGNT